MKSNVLGKRYAGALIAIGRRDGQFERYGKELSAALQMLQSGNNWASFSSPLLPIAAKVQIVDELSKRNGWSKTLTNFLKVLVERKRINVLPSIVDAYIELADDAANRIHATVESAAPLDDATRSRLTQKLVGTIGKQVILDSNVNPSLIGGVKVKVGSQVIDGTIRGQLSRVKDFLMKD